MSRFRSLFTAAVVAATVLPMSVSFAADRRVEIVNHTGVTMSAFHASRASTSDWEENIIRGQSLRSGQSIIIDLDDGTGACKFDFKGTFTDGEEVVSENNDVCTLEQFVFE
ncbi:hypothetical protein [Orrella marina]|uniref:Uncharacterized protein n=1 Tax=Orrella marina TaxID=2163011 RepID=A0A2R4XLE6_9BURK|nr:hypothetical protein [Orrella marina]AWB34581.1 hypothetical protein DBV39_13640 [Orrella marina]